ncbi:acidic mammalian chitinase-like [Bacillus rossius redtenbacheri]|uniref:acidic mammalian chitinase-like n=1 Tax=Bacillus rossius redtenbacheri TaxID=93214 RepID=UPI002FDDBFA2
MLIRVTLIATALLLGACYSAEMEGSDTQDRLFVCYLASWATRRVFSLDDVPTRLCTHLLYAFAALQADGSVAMEDPAVDGPQGLDGYRRFVALKEKNADLKVMVSVGGWAAGSANFSAVVSDEGLRARSAESIASFALQHGFDGVDVDWEYPGRRENSSASDKKNFVLWLELLRQELSKHDFLLSVAVGANRSFIESSYNVPEIAKNVDFITLMTYDFHSSSFENKTGYNAPLFRRPDDDDSLYNVDGCVTAWLDAGAPPGKLLLGMPLYGHSYELADESRAGVGAPTVGPGPANLSTAFGQLCQMLKKEACDWSVSWDEYALVPRATKGKWWISYEDRLSITEKALYAVGRDLGGASVWALDADDWAGRCFNIEYPLLTNILRVIHYDRYLEYRRHSLYDARSNNTLHTTRNNA